MDLDARAGGQRGFSESREIDVGRQVDEAGVGERGGECVGADAAEGRGGDGGQRAVVED